MDGFIFDEVYEQEQTSRQGRGKPVKRKWREIEALKEKNRLRKELQDMDILNHFNEDDVNF